MASLGNGIWLTVEPFCWVQTRWRFFIDDNINANVDLSKRGQLSGGTRDSTVIYTELPIDAPLEFSLQIQVYRFPLFNADGTVSREPSNGQMYILGR